MSENETTAEHLRNALQMLHTLRTFEMSSAEATRHEKALNGLQDRLGAALRQVEGRDR